MINKIPADNRHHQDLGWLRTHWLFSFGKYFDPENVQFGNLRVFNDDFIRPHTGFKPHAHSEMEIVTIVLEGELTHEDSMGNNITIGPGEVQRMSAGTGIRHSEKNDGDEWLNLYQIWFFPDEEGLTPSYDQKQFQLTGNSQSLTALVTPEGADGSVSIHADASIHRGRLGNGETLEYPVEHNRGVFIYLTEGALRINNTDFRQNDQARISEEDSLQLQATESVSFVLIDVANPAAE